MTATDSWHQSCFYRVSLKALIRDENGNILTVSEKGGDSSLPGGGLDNGESAHDGLKRELYEEIGLTSEFSERLASMQTRWLEHKQAWLMWLVYEIKYDKLDYSIGDDGDEVYWISPENLDDSLPAHRMIKQAMAEMSND